MLRIVLSLFFASIGLQAIAADLPARPRLAEQPPLIVVNDWRGFYVGIDAGANLGSFNPLFGAGTVLETSVNLDDNSAFVGGYVGYLAQISSVVIGPEVGLQYWGFKSKGDTGLINQVTEDPLLLQQKIDWVFYANLRLGITPIPSTLLYITGGAAVAHTRGEIINLATIDTSFEQSALGWNAGIGLEFKFSERVTIGAQYTHFDFGNVSPANPTLLTVVSPDKLTVDQAKARITLRLN